MPAPNSESLPPSGPIPSINEGYTLTTVDVIRNGQVERTVTVGPPSPMQDMSRLAVEGATSGAPEYDPRQPEVLQLADGRVLERVHYWDTPGHEAMTAEIAKGRAARYDQANWLDDAESEAAGGMKGPNVEIFALVDPDTRQVVASVRCYHDSDVANLPSYAKALKAGALDPEQVRLVEERTKGRPVAEVGDLFGIKTEYRPETDDEDRLPPCPPDVIFELYRWVAATTMERNGVLILGAVGPEAMGLQWYFPGAVHVLGERFGVDDPAAKKTVKLTPIMLDPPAAPGELLTGVEAEIAEADQAGSEGTWAAHYTEALRRHRTLWSIVEIAPQRLISPALQERLSAVGARIRAMTYESAA